MTRGRSGTLWHAADENSRILISRCLLDDYLILNFAARRTACKAVPHEQGAQLLVIKALYKSAPSARRNFCMPFSSQPSQLAHLQLTQASRTLQNIFKNEGRKHCCRPYGCPRFGRVHGRQRPELDGDRHSPC
jgi:hypothetical protein